jgi:endonuclease IV
MSLNKVYEFGRSDGLLKTVIVKEHNKGTSYETVEFTIKNKLTDQNGKVIIDNGHTSFFEPREFRDFFEPIINDLKARFDNANSIQE